MSDGTYRGRWMDEVFGTPRVSPEVKVLLLAMALDMDDSGRVSTPRKGLAELLRCAPRNVTAKQKSAIDAGLLERVSRGHHGKTAAFQAVIPGEPRVTTGITQPPAKGDDDYHPFSRAKGDDDYHPSNLKGDDAHPPSSGVGGRQSSPHTYSDQRPAANGEDAVVVQLFNVEENSTTSLRSQRAHGRANVHADAKTTGEHPAFADWYAQYPAKKGRGAAVKAFSKAVKKVDDPQTLIDAAIRYRDTDHHVARGFIKNPATWLNQECWLDEPTQTPTTGHAQAAGGHRPWTNPADQSVYDEDI